MRQPIKVDNRRRATVRDTARILGVSKTRTDELIREVRRMIYRNAKTGRFVVRARKSGKIAGNGGSRDAGTKARKTNSRSAKA